jgi:hypothetical protein
VRAGLALAAAALASCASAAPLPSAAGTTFDPTRFFAGRSHGQGVLRKLVGGSSTVVVDSVGRRDRAGTLTLDQTIREGARPPRQRRWIMQASGPGRYTGTLTDASGPVDVTVARSRATIRYRMKGGLDVEQHLAVQSDGRTVLNRLSVRKFGLRVAWLDETIRKVG